MWMLFEDTFTCRNTVATSRMMSLFIMVFGLAILATGIADVVTYSTACPKTLGSPEMDYSALAVGIWGSLPIIFTGLLANFLIDNTAFTIKFLQLSTLASGALFAPAVVVISSIDASLSNRTCGSFNSYAISVCLAVFGGMAVFLLWVLLYRLYCSVPSEDDQQDLVVGRKAQRVYAQKDEFMVSNVPHNPELNNGGTRSRDPSALPTHQIHVPIGGAGAQRPQTSWGYLPSQGASQQLAMVQAPYNASPKQQLAMAQLQQSQMQGGALQTGEQNYYVTFLPGDKIVTNAYPQLYKMTG